jgi:hypothetical protein
MGKLACGCDMLAGFPVSTEMTKSHYEHTFQAMLMWEMMVRRNARLAVTDTELAEARIAYFVALEKRYPEVVPAEPEAAS